MLPEKDEELFPSLRFSVGDVAAELHANFCTCHSVELL